MKAGKDRASNPSADLLPCPFCGGAALLERHECYKNKYEYDVGCILCGAVSEYYTSKKKAIESWNNRDNSHIKERIIEVMEKIMEVV